MKSILLRTIGVFTFLLFTLYGSAQSVAVTGKITGTNGEPLSGVTVQVKGGAASTTTGADGGYQINVPSANSVLVFSYVGFAEQEKTVNNQSEISLSLTPVSNTLQDVVVVGYGTRRRGDVTGSVSSINNEKIRSVPTTNLTQALQGRVAGVEVLANSFRPGSGSRVRIRGNRSFFATNEPLYVVDGIPVTYSIDDMNPADIETVDVLKDASATAVYGVRGANGVVQITTKKAKAGRVSVQYDGNVSFDKILRGLPVFNAPQLADAWRQAFFADRVYNFAQSNTAPNNYFPSAVADAKLFGGTTGNAMWDFIKDAYQFTTFDRGNNTYSSRKIEAALTQNIHYKWLSGMNTPDHNTINRFRSDRLKDVLRQVFTQMVLLLSELGVLTIKELYTHGTKIEAATNRYTFVWGNAIKISKERIKKGLDELWQYTVRVAAAELPDRDPTRFDKIDAQKVEQTIDEINEALKDKPVSNQIKQKLNYAKKNWPANLKNMKARKKY